MYVFNPTMKLKIEPEHQTFSFNVEQELNYSFISNSDQYHPEEIFKDGAPTKYFRENLNKPKKKGH